MIVCPTCGAHNDPGNHFCDQCGTRLDNAETVTAPHPQPPAEPAATTVAAAVATAPTCPNCGAAVMLGQAFCDECGYPLNQVYSDYTASDAPTMLAPPELQGPAPEHPAEPAATGTTATPESEVAQPTEPSAVSPAEPGTTIVTPAPEQAQDMAPVASAPESVTTPGPAAEAPAEPELAPTTAPATATQREPDVTPVAPAGAPAAPAASDEARQRLVGLVVAHRDTVAQYEQMLQRYPPGAAPAFLAAGLDEARKALAQAEADLAALPTGPDPAEVARLEGLITAHRDTVAQYEQMLQRYPPGAAPAFLTAGLDEARKALAQTETELAKLRGQPAQPTGGPAAADVEPPSIPAPPAPESAVEPAAAPVTAVVPPEPAPAAPPRPTGPRMVLDDGHELPLPADKPEIIVGREDPVSQIFPEIDLTPFGGETGGVSRQHARISHSNGQWTITDLNSTNYTRVDGNRIEPNIPTPIHDGTRLQFGRIAVVFRT